MITLEEKESMDLAHENLLEKLINWAVEKKAENIVKLDVSQKTTYTDTLLICTGTSGLHVKAIADNILRNAKGTEIHFLSKEGMSSNEWVLLDAGEVVIHIFREKTREYYKLEDLWNKEFIADERIENHYD